MIFSSAIKESSLPTLEDIILFVVNPNPFKLMATATYVPYAIPTKQRSVIAIVK